MVASSQAPQESSEDQRYFPRWETNNRVLFQLDDDFGVQQASTKDLSCAGACLRVSQPIDQEKVKLTIFLTRDTSVIVDGTVLWNRSDGDSNEVGIAFNNASSQAQDLILQYAFEINHSKVVGRWFEGWDGKKDTKNDK